MKRPAHPRVAAGAGSDSPVRRRASSSRLDQEIQATLWDVEFDPVAGANQCEGTTGGSLGRDVANEQSHEVTTMRIDPENGWPEPVATLAIPSPTCVLVAA